MSDHQKVDLKYRNCLLYIYAFDFDLHSDHRGGGMNFCYIAWRVGV